MITSQDVALDDVWISCLKKLRIEVRDLLERRILVGEINDAELNLQGLTLGIIKVIERPLYSRRSLGERKSSREEITLPLLSLSLRVFGGNLMLKVDGVDITVRGGSRCVETSMARELREKQEMLHVAQAEAIEASSSP